MMPIAMIKGWSPSIRSSIGRDSSLLGLLAKLRNNIYHNQHHRHPFLPQLNYLCIAIHFEKDSIIIVVSVVWILWVEASATDSMTVDECMFPIVIKSGQSTVIKMHKVQV
jgi:hypothetical protein